MTSDISPLKPGSGLAQAGSYLQLLGSLLIVVLLVFVVLTSIRERYKQDLDGVVSELRDTSEGIGRFLEANYELTMAGAVYGSLASSSQTVRNTREHYDLAYQAMRFHRQWQTLSLAYEASWTGQFDWSIHFAISVMSAFFFIGFVK
jgi:thiosulfate reductase cytochrome b subunit